MAIKISLSPEEAKKKKLFVATPMYGGMCAGMFAKSCADLAAMCQYYGIGLQMYFLFNESLIPRARNYCCDEFMRSDATHLMFIDADIGFNPNDVLALLALQSDDSPYDVIGGPYPKKCVSWEKIKMAVDKGFADEDPENLSKFVGDYVFNPKGNQTEIPLASPVEVLEIGTGFMMIRRKTMDKFVEYFPQYHYKPDHVRTEHFDGSREIMQFFQAEIDPASKRYLSEDYWFCFDAQTRVETEHGIKTIKSIVDNKYNGKVLSFNVESGQMEWKPVVNHWARPNGKRGNIHSKKKWVTLDTNSDNNRKAKLKVTDDHKVAAFTDIFSPSISFLPAKELKGKYIVRNPQDTENVLYSNEQLSMLIGTLMGDSSINKNGQLTCQHSVEQGEYCTLKSDIFNGKLIGPVKNHGFGQNKYKTIMYAPVNAQTKKLRNIMYDSGTKTIRNIIHLIDEKALAFWYMDDGSLNNKNNAYISSCNFSDNDHDILKRHLKERFDLDVIIDTKKTQYNGKVHYYKYLRMKKESSDKFFRMISRYIPPCMEYKLPTHFRGGNDKFDYSEIDSLGFAASLVKNVKYLPKNSSRLYDIEVADNHNFVASGTVAHNCQKLQEAGLKTWLCPWMAMQHVGTYVFSGSLADLAALGAPATADAGMLNEIKEKKKKKSS